MKHRLLSIASLAILLFMVLGNCIGCGTTPPPTTQYTLTMASTAGGSVTPAVGTYTYNASQVVNLTATPNSGYSFVDWTGNVGTIANVNAASTNITMSGNYTITANFALGTLIAGVPDTNQPPTQLLGTTVNITNYCAPIAMVNVLGYWDYVKGLADAKNVTAFNGTPPNLNYVAEYLGWFMATNGPPGDPRRLNGTTWPPAPGTYDADIGPGTVSFVRWDLAHNPPEAPPPALPLPVGGLPAGKLGYTWTVTNDYDLSPGAFTTYKAEIDAGRPLVVCFLYWNPVSAGVNATDPKTGETVSVFTWGSFTSNSTNPAEQWNNVYGNESLGHAVTGVGYVLNWTVGGQPAQDYVIVHDTWSTTPMDIAIPWAHWNSLHAVLPGP